MEKRLGRSVVSSKKASDYLAPTEETKPLPPIDKPKSRKE